MKQRLFASAILVGVIVMLWRVSVVVGDLNSWAAWDQPAEVSKLLQAGVAGLVAFAGAIGVNVKELLGGFLSAPQVVSAEKLAELSEKAGV